MNYDFTEQRFPPEIASGVAGRMRERRREHRLTQAELAQKSGVSLASLRRFEKTGEISLRSLLKLAIAMKCEADFDTLFARKHYRSIQEVIDERR
ncbi:MAG: helix-turn-helix domain-containing protein [Coriobacteriales bacterium]|jgi:transcriptional regulator with XRE-family HTH domain|nr:helix-turn-helix domain-containing protein [Coriobacteriales bacterium]